MPKLYVAMRPERKALFLPMGRDSKSPSLIFPLIKNLRDPSELEEHVRKQLAKLGITKEADIQALMDKEAENYEARIKLAEARKLLRKYMDIKKKSGKLMQTGHKKWSEVSYRPIGRKNG